MTILELKYWPEENEYARSAWRLARKDNAPVKFPGAFDLMRFFRRLVPQDPVGLTVIKRGVTFRIVLMSSRLPKRCRETFLAELEKRLNSK